MVLLFFPQNKLLDVSNPLNPASLLEVSPDSKRRIAILGSTGSIGVSTLKIVEAYPERFSVTSLAAGNNGRAGARARGSSERLS